MNSIISQEPIKMDGLPWWLKAIYQVGVPSAIAVFLVWFVTQGMTFSINRIADNQDMLQKAINVQAGNFEYLVREQMEVKGLLQQICANTAVTNKDRALCFQ